MAAPALFIFLTSPQMCELGPFISLSSVQGLEIDLPRLSFISERTNRIFGEIKLSGRPEHLFRWYLIQMRAT